MNEMGRRSSMPCAACAELELTTYLRWMRDNVTDALQAREPRSDGTHQPRLNSALGLLTAVYCEALGKMLAPNENRNGYRFHAFVSRRLAHELEPHSPVAERMALLTPTPPFDRDPHTGHFAFWSMRNGFAHAFAPASKHQIEFRWTRSDQQESWLSRKGQACVGEGVCSKTQVEVIDLNVSYVAQVFLRANREQENLWRAEAENNKTYWQELLRRLQR